MTLTRILNKAGGTLLLLFLLFIPVVSYAALWVIEETDTAEPISEAQIDELEKQALAGDRRFKQEFAAAYLELRDPRFGCKRFKYGHRCRAMGKRTSSGHAFLMEIINAEPSTELEWDDRIGFFDLERYRIGSFQFRYAMLRYDESAPRFDQGTDSCKDTVRYYELAVRNGHPCVAVNNLYLMAWLGRCMPKSIERANAYRTKIPPRTACPKI